VYETIEIFQKIHRFRHKLGKEQYSLTDKATGHLTEMLKENDLTAEIASFGPLTND
jgi:hypothetical protein